MVRQLILISLIITISIQIKAQENSDTTGFQIPPDGIYKTFADLRLGIPIEGIISYEFDTTLSAYFNEQVIASEKKKFCKLKKIEFESKEIKEEIIVYKKFARLLAEPIFYAVVDSGAIYINQDASYIDSDLKRESFNTYRDDVYMKVTHIGKFLYFDMPLNRDATYKANNMLPFSGLIGTVKINSYVVNLNSTNGRIFRVDKKLLASLLKSDDKINKAYQKDNRDNSYDKRKEFVIEFSEKYAHTVLSKEAYRKKVEKAIAEKAK